VVPIGVMEVGIRIETERGSLAATASNPTVKSIEKEHSGASNVQSTLNKSKDIFR